MANRKIDISHPFFKVVSKTFYNRLAELGISPYSFCLENKLNNVTFSKVLKNKSSLSVAALLRYIDAAGLELKIVKKEEANEDNN